MKERKVDEEGLGPTMRHHTAVDRKSECEIRRQFERAIRKRSVLHRVKKHQQEQRLVRGRSMPGLVDVQVTNLVDPEI
jgi:hypothetical protein